MEVILAAILGGFLLLGGVATPNRAEQIAEKTLRQQFPGAKVEVEIRGKRGADVLNGQFKSVEVEMRDLTLAKLPISLSNAPARTTGKIALLKVWLRDFKWNDTSVESAQLRFENVEYDFEALQSNGQLRLMRFGAATLDLTVGAQSLLPIFTKRIEGVDNLRPQFRGGQLRVSGEKRLLGLTAPLELTGKVVARGAQVQLENAQLSLSGFGVPKTLSDAILKDSRVLFDFDRDFSWPFSVVLTDVKADDDRLEMRAVLGMK